MNKVLEQLKEEYNETLNRMQDLGDILAHCAEMDTSHCGQDADMDDACCQARGHQPAGYTYNDLLGMEVMFVFPHCHKCGDCTFRKGADGSECPCVKVELVGGDYICLAKRPVVTGLDDSPKSFEEAYRDSMNLLREFCIKQSEANQRLVEALKEESEELKKPFINFDEEDEQEDTTPNIMGAIKEKVDDFMNYLDSVVNG